MEDQQLNQDNFDSLKISNFLIELFKEKKEYFNKKHNLANITNQNTWNNVNKKILELFNEN